MAQGFDSAKSKRGWSSKMKASDRTVQQQGGKQNEDTGNMKNAIRVRGFETADGIDVVRSQHGGNSKKSSNTHTNSNGNALLTPFALNRPNSDESRLQSQGVKDINYSDHHSIALLHDQGPNGHRRKETTSGQSRQPGQPIEKSISEQQNPDMQSLGKKVFRSKKSKKCADITKQASSPVQNYNSSASRSKKKTDHESLRSGVAGTQKDQQSKDGKGGDYIQRNNEALMPVKSAASYASSVNKLRENKLGEMNLSQEFTLLLEENKIFILKKANVKFPKANFFCRLCDYHLDLKEDCDKHMKEYRHCRRKKTNEVDAILRSLPKPTENQLAALTTVVEDINEKYGISNLEQKERANVVKRLEERLKEQIPDVVMFMYGSSLTGFGLKTSDINVDLTSTNKDRKLTALLTEVCRCLNDMTDSGFSNVRSDFAAKVPCLLLTDNVTGLTVNITIHCYSAHCTSELLSIYSEFDIRVKKLAVAFRYWAHLCCLDRHHDGFFPPQALNLLLIYFLQIIDPQVVPIIQPPKVTGDEVGDFKKDAPKFEKMRKKVTRVNLSSRNTLSLGELWLRLLKFYSLEFDTSRVVVSIRSNQDLSRHTKPWNSKRLAVEDPYMLKKNVTHMVKISQVYEYWQDSLNRALYYFGLPRDSEGKTNVPIQDLKKIIHHINREPSTAQTRGQNKKEAVKKNIVSGNKETKNTQNVLHDSDNSKNSAARKGEASNEEECSAPVVIAPNPLLSCIIAPPSAEHRTFKLEHHSKCGSLVLDVESKREIEPKFLNGDHEPQVAGESGPQVGGEKEPQVLSGESESRVVGDESGRQVVGDQSGPQSVGGESGPQVVGGESGPQVVGGESESQVQSGESGPQSVGGECEPQVLSGVNEPHVLAGPDRFGSGNALLSTNNDRQYSHSESVDHHLKTQHISSVDPADARNHPTPSMSKENSELTETAIPAGSVSMPKPAFPFQRYGLSASSKQTINQNSGSINFPNSNVSIDLSKPMKTTDSSLDEFDDIKTFAQKYAHSVLDNAIEQIKSEQSDSCSSENNEDSDATSDKDSLYCVSYCEPEVQGTGTSTPNEALTPDRHLLSKSSLLSFACDTDNIHSGHLSSKPTHVSIQPVQEAELIGISDQKVSPDLSLKEIKAEPSVFGTSNEVPESLQENSEKPEKVSVRQEEVADRQEEVADRQEEVADRQEEVPRKQEDIFSILAQGNCYYEFSEANLTDGKGPVLTCTYCEKEGHLKNTCPEDELPEILPLPKLTSHHVKVLSETLSKVPAEVGLSEESLAEREVFMKSLEEFIQTQFKDAKLALFGSTCNGFGFDKSDMDICLTFTQRKAPEKCYLIEVLAKRLKLHTDLTNVQPIPTAKVPIVKFTVRKTKLEGDISLYNILAQQNTKLLLCYSKIDPRVSILGYTIKTFAKVCDIGDASRGSLSSYAYILMMLYYLQQVQPPVIPVLQELFKGKKKPQYIIEEWDAWFMDDLSQLDELWPEKGKNQMSVAELWLGFLCFYVEEFKHNEYVVSIRQKELLTRFEKLWNGSCLAIEDPFDLNHNLGSGLTRKMNNFILKTFINGRMLYGSPIDDNVDMFNKYQSPSDYFFDTDLLSECRPPNVRGCRRCGKIGHLLRHCPAAHKDKEEEQKRLQQQQKQQQQKQQQQQQQQPALSKTSVMTKVEQDNLQDGAANNINGSASTSMGQEKVSIFGNHPNLQMVVPAALRGLQPQMFTSTNCPYPFSIDPQRRNIMPSGPPPPFMPQHAMLTTASPRQSMAPFNTPPPRFPPNMTYPPRYPPNHPSWQYQNQNWLQSQRAAQYSGYNHAGYNMQGMNPRFQNMYPN